MIKAIVFDCFGVLIGRGFNATYRLAGGDPIQDRHYIDDLLGAANAGVITVQDMVDSLCEKLHISADAWYEVIAQAELPDKQLLEYIKSLKATHKVAILSNANKGTLQSLFSPEQLDIFDAVVVSAEVGMVKPDERIYELAAERLNVEPSECLFTDDSDAYCQGARATGMQAIHYKDFLQFKNDLEFILDHT